MVLKSGIRRRLIVVQLVGFLLIWGVLACAWAAGEESEVARSIRRDIELKYLEEAVGTFNAGDYGKAKSAFEMLSESTQSQDIGRQALYGLAASKLFLARTADEYRDALTTWEKWSGMEHPGTNPEDPRLLTPFLLHMEPVFKAAKTRTQVGKAKEADLQSREKETQSLRAKLEQRDREIRRLRHQLESLEEIHRKYQEKKQEATF